MYKIQRSTPSKDGFDLSHTLTEQFAAKILLKIILKSEEVWKVCANCTDVLMCWDSSPTNSSDVIVYSPLLCFKACGTQYEMILLFSFWSLTITGHSPLLWIEKSGFGYSEKYEKMKNEIWIWNVFWYFFLTSKNY